VSMGALVGGGGFEFEVTELATRRMLATPSEEWEIYSGKDDDTLVQIPLGKD
jgi:hypothetical protein